MTSTTDPLGHITTFHYDALDRQTQVDRRARWHDDHGLRRRRQRDEHDRPARPHDRRITTTRLNRQTEMIDALGGTDDHGLRRRRQCDEHDRPARPHDDVSLRRAQSPDRDDRSAWRYVDHGLRRRRQRDHARPTRWATPRRTTTTRSIGRPERSIPSATPTTTAYDADGNVMSMTDPLGHTTTYHYDALNRQTKAIDASWPYDDHRLRRRRQRDEHDRPARPHDDLSLRRAQPPDRA